MIAVSDGISVSRMPQSQTAQLPIMNGRRPSRWMKRPVSGVIAEPSR